MKITNKLNLPAGFVKACSPEKHNAQGCLSATTLIMGIKQILLMERPWDELEDDVSDRLWAIWGQAVHSLMESEGENNFTEQKMAYKVKGVTVTGTIDSYDMKHGIIFDYKTASVNKIKFKDFKDWYLQGMIYAWLLSKNKFPVNKRRFIALLKDFSRTEAIRDYQYPKEPVYVFKFPVTLQALFKIEMFINDKVNEYRRCVALDDNIIPSCTPEERWERPPKFAVMKKGLKKRCVCLMKRIRLNRWLKKKAQGILSNTDKANLSDVSHIVYAAASVISIVIKIKQSLMKEKKKLQNKQPHKERFIPLYEEIN